MIKQSQLDNNTALIYLLNTQLGKTMTLTDFLTLLSHHPDQIEFSEAMAVIDQHYSFSPSRFINGGTVNEKDQNNGSCKIFAFALLNTLSVPQTLACFGTYYRDDVLANPHGEDHQNIRNFMISGWEGIKFESAALTTR